MEIVVKEKVAPEAKPRTYSVVIKTMLGDADGYKYVSIKGFEEDRDEPLLFELVDLLTRMKDRFPHGRGGSDEYSYSTVEGFLDWFDPDAEDEETEDALIHSEAEERTVELRTRLHEFFDRTDWYYWPSDGGSGWGHDEASYVDYAIYYYDKDGVKRHAAVLCT